MKISGIYKIINKIDGKYYVGSSCDIESPNVGRWYKHRYMLKAGIHNNTHLQNAWNKYGEENFDFLILENCTAKELIKIEQKYLDIAREEADSVYNCTFIAGKIEMTEETRRKIGNKTKERLKNPENHPMFGKHHSEETKKLIAENSPRYGRDNGMYGKSRIGEDNPNYGRGDKIRGILNSRYNHAIFTFFNTASGKEFVGTKYDFCKNFKKGRSTPNDLLTGKSKKTKDGWIITT